MLFGKLRSGLWEALLSLHQFQSHTRGQHGIYDQVCLLLAFLTYLSLSEQLQPRAASFKGRRRGEKGEPPQHYITSKVKRCIFSHSLYGIFSQYLFNSVAWGRWKQTSEPKLGQRKLTEFKRSGDISTDHLLIILISESLKKEPSTSPTFRPCTLSCIPTSKLEYSPGVQVKDLVVGAWPKSYVPRCTDVCATACSELFLLHLQLFGLQSTIHTQAAGGTLPTGPVSPPCQRVGIFC